METLLSAEGCLIVRLALWGRWEWVDVLPFRVGEWAFLGRLIPVL